ncbi:MAG TPA: hypothetical protein VHZ31_04305 [Solirubrobacteraceae bacterium]|nr:hypothetical protein [Solirubrobacteraceae bacterium]
MPREPVRAQACVYYGASDLSKPATAQPAVLDRALSRTLALLLRRGLARGGRRGCVDVPALYRLRGADGSLSSFTVAGCSPGMVARGAAVAPLTPFAVDALEGEDRLDDGPQVPTPRFAGRKLPSTLLLARRMRAQSVTYVELDDPAARFGTVAWQIPLPGARQEADGFETVLYVATRRAAPCRARQVVGRYLGGGKAGGQDFGNIALLDVSARPCAVRGRLRLQPRDRRGGPLRRARAGPAGDEIVLSPGARPQMLDASDLSPPALIASLMFSGYERGGEANGDCRLVRPAAWRVTFNGDQRITVRNADDEDAFASCSGVLGIDDVLRLR